MTNKKNDKQKLSVINPNAAGIDIGSREHCVCVPADRDEKNVRKFAAFTSDLREMADWLLVFQILETTGFEVILVNARHVKNVPGRKTDVADCQWLQQLHSYGLLSGSFRPEDQICELRTLTRQRDRLTKNATTHVNRMQKALNEMNIQLHHVISNITGVTGMNIIKAIIEGERDANKLAAFRDYRIKSDEKTIVKALEGDYRKEHLFVLKQEFELYMGYLKKIEEIDIEIEGHYKDFEPKGNEVVNHSALQVQSLILRHECLMYVLT